MRTRRRRRSCALAPPLLPDCVSRARVGVYGAARRVGSEECAVKSVVIPVPRYACVCMYACVHACACSRLCTSGCVRACDAAQVPDTDTRTHTHTGTHLYMTRALVTAPSVPGSKARGNSTRSINSGSTEPLPNMCRPRHSLPHAAPCCCTVSREISAGDQMACQIENVPGSRLHRGTAPWLALAFARELVPRVLLLAGIQ